MQNKYFARYWRWVNNFTECNHDWERRVVSVNSYLHFCWMENLYRTGSRETIHSLVDSCRLLLSSMGCASCFLEHNKQTWTRENGSTLLPIKIQEAFKWQYAPRVSYLLRINALVFSSADLYNMVTPFNALYINVFSYWRPCAFF